jgi:hypothetical protein
MSEIPLQNIGIRNLNIEGQDTFLMVVKLESRMHQVADEHLRQD